MISTPLRLVMVEDEDPYRHLICTRLTERGYKVAGFRSGEEALAAGEEWDIALIDLRLPGMGGIELLKKFKETTPSPVILILTGQATMDTAIEAMKLGALDYLAKPCKLAELELAIRNAGERVALERENRLLKIELRRHEAEAPVLGHSAAMQTVKCVVEKVAPTDSSVLILGESGTGKEVIARALHKMSRRAAKPFFAVNCAALPESLLENELFGHEKGAFTGATERASGLFEAADGATLFLDEIGDMPLVLQAKLLRVLDLGEFTRVGSTKTMKTNVRVISATNKDLRQRIAQGLFREDLFYRLNVVTIALPSLRERHEDIPLFVRYFLENVTRRGGSHVTVTNEAMVMLMQYAWPGNVRELANVLERAVILCGNGCITPEDLALTVLPARVERCRIQGRWPSLEEVERAYIEQVLQEEQGNKTRAAKVLGVSLRNLYRKVEDYGLLLSPSDGGGES
jgi:DNA-binding NtrC family response regulator